MPRALSLQRAIVPSHARARYLERVQERKAFYARYQCRFWVFEEAALVGAFIEFAEAADPAILAAALAASPDPGHDPARIYTELELT